MYSLLKAFSILTPASKFNIVEALRSNFSVLLPNVDSISRLSNSAQDGDDGGTGDAVMLERLASHRNAFKIYTFFLVHIVLAEEASCNTNTTSRVSHYILLTLLFVGWSIVFR